MDPQIAWNEMVGAYRDRDPDRVREHASALKEWLEKGGFPPDTSSVTLKHDDWNRYLANAGVRFALEYAAAWEGGE